jgi:hypothetical protein
MMMPVPGRISAGSLGPLRNAATVTSCKYPASALPVPASFCYVNQPLELPVASWYV